MESKTFAPPPLLSQAHRQAKAVAPALRDDRGASIEAGLAALEVPHVQGRGHGFSVAWHTRMSVEDTVEQACYSSQLAGEALSRIQESLAVFVEAAVIAVGDTFKRPGSDGKIWLRVSENVEQGCLFAIESMAFGDGLGEIIALLLDWCPSLGAHSIKKQYKTTAEQKAYSFDGFLHMIPSYNNTNAPLSELLENIVECVVVEIVALLLKHYDGGPNLAPPVCERLLNHAFRGAAKVRPNILPEDLFASLRGHIGDHWAYVLGRVTPQYFPTVVDRFLVAQKDAAGSDVAEEHTAKLFRLIRGVHIKWDIGAVGPHHRALNKLLSAFLVAFDAYPTLQVRRRMVTALDAILQQVDFTELRLERGDSAAKEIWMIADSMSTIWGMLEKWNPRKSPDKELGSEYVERGEKEERRTDSACYVLSCALCDVRCAMCVGAVRCVRGDAWCCTLGS